MRFAWALLAFVASLAGAQAVAQPALFPPPGEMIASPTEELPEGKFDPPSTPWKPPAAVEPTPVTSSGEGDTPAEAGSPGAGDETSDLKKDDGAADVIVNEKRTWYQRVFLVVPEPWDTGVELGLNGAAGTSDSFSMRTGGYIKRQSRFSKLDTSLYYNRTGAGGVITQNNAQFDVRNDWLLDDKSPWTLFGTNSVFYDQFKDFDLQTNVDGGVGYRFYHEKELELIGRVGAGTSREFGGEDDRWVPEGLFGVEYSQQLNATQKVYSKLDWFPELDDTGEFRAVADVGWEVVLVQPSNLSLKISANDRYDSTPNGAEPHLLNYSVLLLLKL